jgi:hypothetical protein
MRTIVPLALAVVGAAAATASAQASTYGCGGWGA